MEWRWHLFIWGDAIRGHEGIAGRHWYLVSYDIRDQRRWRKAYQVLCGTGEWVQYSLFRCHLNRTELEGLRWRLEKILAQEDDLLIIHLCPSCAPRVRIWGERGGWEQDRPRFEIP